MATAAERVFVVMQLIGCPQGAGQSIREIQAEMGRQNEVGHDFSADAGDGGHERGGGHDAEWRSTTQSLYQS
jgi:hypothetical protein